MHRRLGMTHSDVVQVLSTTITGSPEKHLQVYHIVHDGIVRPSLFFDFTRPTQNGTYPGIEKFGQLVGRADNDIPVGRTRRDAHPVAETAMHQKAQIMVVRVTIGQISQ